ncbi:hypothetical protein D9M69_465900 [compost metagenome]
MLLQTAVAAIVQHRQRIDRTVEGEFAPQPGQNLRAPLVGNAGSAQVIKPDRRHRMARIPQPGEAMPGKHHAPIAIAEGAFCARGIDAACLRNLCGYRVLTAQAILQQDQFGAWGQAWRQSSHRTFGIVGFARHQQAVDRLRVVGCLGGHGIVLRLAVFHQCQSTGSLIGLQSRGVPQDQPDRHASPCQTCRP